SSIPTASGCSSVADPRWTRILAGLFWVVGGACGGDDDDDGLAPCEAPTWQTLVDDSDEDADDLGASVLGVWGRAPDDVWFSGGTLGVEPRASLAMYFD